MLHLPVPFDQWGTETLDTRQKGQPHSLIAIPILKHYALHGHCSVHWKDRKLCVEKLSHNHTYMQNMLKSKTWEHNMWLPVMGAMAGRGGDS